MKRNALLMTALLFCLATSAFAADGKHDSQPQPTEQTQMAQTQTSQDQTTTNKDCATKSKKAKQKSQRHDAQPDLELWQSQLIYGIV
jgi:hypothetical protein